MTAAICCPIVYTGFNDMVGSWKIMDAPELRSVLISDRFILRTSLPSKNICRCLLQAMSSPCVRQMSVLKPSLSKKLPCSSLTTVIFSSVLLISTSRSAIIFRRDCPFRRHQIQGLLPAPWHGEHDNRLLQSVPS